MSLDDRSPGCYTNNNPWGVLMQEEHSTQAEQTESELIAELTRLYEESTHYIRTILLARDILKEYRKDLASSQEEAKRLRKELELAADRLELAFSSDGSGCFEVWAQEARRALRGE